MYDHIVLVSVIADQLFVIGYCNKISFVYLSHKSMHFLTRPIRRQPI